MRAHRLVELGKLPVEYRPVVRRQRRHDVMGSPGLDRLGHTRHRKDRNTIGNSCFLGPLTVAGCAQADRLQPPAELLELARRRVGSLARKRTLDLSDDLVVFLRNACPFIGQAHPRRARLADRHGPRTVGEVAGKLLCAARLPCHIGKSHALTSFLAKGLVSQPCWLARQRNLVRPQRRYRCAHAKSLRFPGSRWWPDQWTW